MKEIEFRLRAKHADVLLALQRAESEISNVRGGAGTSYLGNYLQAVDTNDRMLSDVFPIDVVDELVRTQDYWALRSAPEGHATTHQAIGRSCDRERQRLHDLWDVLRLEGLRWQRPESRLLVVGTTMLMDADRPSERIEWDQHVKEKWARIVVPLATIQELDNH